MVLALIPVGDSKRLRGKHFLELGGKPIIDIIFEKLHGSKLFENIIVYTVVDLKIDDAIIIKDNDKRGVLNVLLKSLADFDDNIFLIGGDMPFFSIHHISKILNYPEQLSVIPRWSNGYLEPLHSLYSVSALEYPERASFHEFINQIPRIFLPAESFPSNEFFNINTPEDYEMAKKLYQNSYPQS